MNLQQSSYQTLPLSLSQREVWLDQRAWPDSTHLLIGGVGFFQVSIDPVRLEMALVHLVAENEALRLVPQQNGTQILLDHVNAKLEVIELDEAVDLRQTAQDWWRQRTQMAFGWGTEPPWRFALIRCGNGAGALIYQLHHLVMDGWSTATLTRRWSQVYNALQAGGRPVEAVAPTYRQFVEESNAYLESPGFERDAQFWQAQLPELQPQLIGHRYAAVPTLVIAPAVLSRQSVPSADYQRLVQTAAERGSSAFNYFLAALVLYFSRVANRDTVVVGVPSLNRSGRRYRDTLGMFVGVLPVSVSVLPTLRVSELLASVGAAMRSALRHPRYPLSELGRHLELMRHGRDGLFDLLLSFERQDYLVSFGDARMVESRQLFSGMARYALSVTACEFQADQDLELILEGSSACFEDAELASLGQRLWHLVEQLMLEPDAGIDQIALLSPTEQDAVIHSFHAQTLRHDTPVAFITQFEQQVLQCPHAVALVWDGGALSYTELNQLAGHLAHRLVGMGAARDRIVGVAMARSVDMVVAILAISKAGAAFLPLDPDAPLARLASIVGESDAVALLVQDHDLERLAPLHARTVVTRWEDAQPDAGRHDPLVVPQGGDLAYVLFTSGSTGKPKGVMMAQAALSRRLAWLSREYAVVPTDRSAQATQVVFDPSLIELCLPLIHGASVALPPPGRLTPKLLADFALRHGVTIMAFVPTTLSGFLDFAGNHADLKLRVACCGGDVLSAELSNRFLSETKARLFNVYGPTEACIFASAWACEPRPRDAVLPVGQAVDDTRIYVLSSNTQVVPVGVVGDIYLGGGAIARGYLNRPELDAEVFLADPFVPGKRMYRTGDRGWLAANGVLNFVGRDDRQVKLRGYRIELGEIEAALLALEGVRQAAVKLVTRFDKSVLYAWVGTTSGLGAEGLQRHLRTRLPDYMIPAGISVLASLPSSAIGKIDYHALQDEEVPFKSSHTRAATGLEIELLKIWEDVLNIRPLNVHDNFFDIGGDSLAAVTVLVSTEKLVSAKVPLYLLTENPTVERLALALGQRQALPGPLVSFNAASTRVPMYLAVSGYGDLIRFKSLAKLLEPACDLHMLQPPMGHPVGSMSDLAKVYAEIIEAQGATPGYVAGFSVGGIAALETVRLLKDKGVAIRGLVLIDTVYPGRVWGSRLFWRLFGWLVRHLRLQELSMNGRRLGAMFNDSGLLGQVMALAGYRPRRFDGPIMLVKSTGLAGWDWFLFRPWRKLMGQNLTESVVTGLHGSIFEANHVDELAMKLIQIVEPEQG